MNKKCMKALKYIIDVLCRYLSAYMYKICKSNAKQRESLCQFNNKNLFLNRCLNTSIFTHHWGCCFVFFYRELLHCKNKLVIQLWFAERNGGHVSPATATNKLNICVSEQRACLRGRPKFLRKKIKKRKPQQLKDKLWRKHRLLFSPVTLKLQLSFHHREACLELSEFYLSCDEVMLSTSESCGLFFLFKWKHSTWKDLAVSVFVEEKLRKRTCEPVLIHPVELEQWDFGYRTAEITLLFTLTLPLLWLGASRTEAKSPLVFGSITNSHLRVLWAACWIF